MSRRTGILLILAAILALANIVSLLPRPGEAQVAPGPARLAAQPSSMRLSDGSGFYDGTKTGQLPSALGQTTMAGSVSVAIASNQSALSINSTPVGLVSLATGQQAVTASAVALPSNAAKRICIRVLASGTQTVYFGAAGVSTTTGQELAPGDAWCGELDNTNRVYVIAGGTGSTVAFDALN